MYCEYTIEKKEWNNELIGWHDDDGNDDDGNDDDNDIDRCRRTNLYMFVGAYVIPFQTVDVASAFLNAKNNVW